MAVAFDALGGGSGSTGATTYTWTHTLGAITNGAVLVGIALDASPDTATCTATFGGTSMTSLGVKHCNNSTAGYIQVFGLATASQTGAKTVTVTATAAPTDMNGGSLSFSGVNQAAPFGTPGTGAGSGTTATAATAGSTSGGMVAGFMASGSAISAATAPATSRFIDNFRTVADQAAGCSAGATSPSTGSAVTMAWTLTTDFWAVLAVELGSTGLLAPAGLAAATAAAQQPGTIPSSLFSGPNYASLAADSGGGAGSWLNPSLAQGPP